MERERPPPAVAPPKWPPRYSGQANVRRQELFWGLPRGCRSTRIWANFSCFPKTISRELNESGPKWDANVSSSFMCNATTPTPEFDVFKAAHCIFKKKVCLKCPLYGHRFTSPFQSSVLVTYSQWTHYKAHFHSHTTSQNTHMLLPVFFQSKWSPLRQLPFTHHDFQTYHQPGFLLYQTSYN